jgi:fructokinase
MKYDVVALGELLIDFTSGGLSDRGNMLFEANPGGAPGNVLAMLNKLDRTTAFIGKVGDDFLGRSIVGALEQLGIGTQAVSYHKSVNTTLAFVNNKADGDREFAFIRNPGADTQLSVADVPIDVIQNARIFHFGSLSLTNEPSRTATQNAVSIAKKSDVLVSFDPNLRPLLWENAEAAQRQIEWGCSNCDILKISDDETAFLTKCNGTKAGAEQLLSSYPNIRLLFITKGKNGSEGYWGNVFAEQPVFHGITAIDTTGAGDTFLGCCLSFVLDCSIDNPQKSILDQMLLFANAAAGLVTTKYGALRSMPEKDSIEALIAAAAESAERRTSD